MLIGVETKLTGGDRDSKPGLGICHLDAGPEIAALRIGNVPCSLAVSIVQSRPLLWLRSAARSPRGPNL